MVNFFTQLSRYFKSHDFKRALLMAFTMLICGVILYNFQSTHLIIGVSIGILLTSFSDIQGSYRNRIYAMLLSIVMNLGIIITMNLLQPNQFLVVAFIILIVFPLGLISIYGNRASLFSFSGLLGLVLSLIRQYESQELINYLITFVIGGLIYVIISTTYHWLTRKNQTVEQLGGLTLLTADYLNLRVKIANNELERDDAINKLLALQNEIITKQEQLRELILADSKISGQSNTRNRQMLILIELIDIMELAIANPANFSKVKKKIGKNNEALKPFIDLLESNAKQLKAISATMLDNRKLKPFSTSDHEFEVIDTSINKYINNIGLPKARPAALMLLNLKDYLDKQNGKIKSIERLINDVKKNRNLVLTEKQQAQFLTKVEYDPRQLLENFSIKSSVFRHALRLTVAMVIGYIIGILFNIENAYWILLTISVIMRPSYGLTKERSIQRVLGTLIGAVLAAGIVLLTHNPYVYVALALISLILAFSLINRNYLLSAIGITLNVVFLFSLLAPNPWSVIQYRIIDTVLGAIISIAVGYFILPSWEFKTIRYALKDAIESNQNYIMEIASLYKFRLDDTNYRVSRKKAFLNTSELNGAYQRLTADPKSKQKNIAIYYKLVTINQAIISSLANLGSSIQKHTYTDLNREVQIIMNTIRNELGSALKAFKEEVVPDSNLTNSLFLDAQNEINKLWDMLEEKRNEQIESGQREIETTFRLQLQELRLIQEELDYLLQLSKSMKETVQQLKR